ncbi:Subtilase family protein [Methylobacterium sp. ap11]|uniref:S8 family serine peptidase n=1 Tax=Methylobacterium sp. ap11 TaxID=1761799 RepID=UPI0008D10EFC|nr:S8 family serine peptidase [Methylobacterium sp. ap11]SEP33555.1 Subtilase family protein [Methylobacterium sp. ap11]
MARESDRRAYVREQIEFIRRNNDEDVHEVIIKAGLPDSNDQQLVTTVAQALQRRSLSTSPRDVLPIRRELLEEASKRTAARGRRASAALKRSQLEDQSLAAQVARRTERPQALRNLREHNLNAMRPLMQSAVIQDSLATGSGRGRRPAAPQPRAFWTSGSFLVRMRDKELPKLIDADAAEGIEGVYLNRKLLVPPMVTPKQLPQSVEDNKVSAWGIRMIGALAVWGAFGCRGQGIKVGLLDTGVDAGHPDLAGKITAWAEFDAKGAQIVKSTPHDPDGHGTHCAGTIVGGNASGRWIGVAPEAEIAAALVISGAKGGTDAQVLAGIDWAIDQGVDVINMSLGGLIWGPDVPSTYTSAILNALRVGIPVVTAIGNEGSQTSGSPGNDLFAFAVGATDYRSWAAGFSGGRTQAIRKSPFFPVDTLPLVYSKPDISAPGVAVLSAAPNGEWRHLNGTSMAAPHVAGAVALLLSATDIKDTVKDHERAFVIQDLLTGSAEELGEAGQDHRFGFGRLDVLRAIGFAKDLGY